MPAHSDRGKHSSIEPLESRQLLTAVNSVAFNYVTSQSITQSFDSNVSSSYSIDDLSLMNLTTDSAAARANLLLSLNGAGTTATVTFPGLTGTGSLTGVLSDGNWESIIEQEGFAGLLTPYIHQFFFLAGDANHDRAVSAADFNIWAGNSGQSGSFNYSQADFTYDTIVNSADYNLLATNFGRQIPEPITSSNSLTANALSSSSNNITWTAPATGSPDGYRIYMGTDGITCQFLDVVGSATFSYTHSGLNDGTKRWYRVRPFTTTSGNGTTTNESSSVTVMNAPSGLSVTAVSTGGTNLSWTNNSSTASGFKIERSLLPKTGYDAIATTTTTATTYHDGSALENTTYYYRVSAVNSVAESAPCYRVSAATAAVYQPSNVLASNAANGNVTITWESESLVTQNYMIRRFRFVNIAWQTEPEATVTVAGSVRSHLFTDTVADEQYRFTVQGTTSTAQSQVTTPVENFTEPTETWTSVGPPSAPSYVTWSLLPEPPNPLYGYGNEQVTLQLNGLPRHSWARVGITLIASDGNPSSENTSVVTGTSDGTELRATVDRNTVGQTVWTLAINANGQGLPDAFRHDKKSMTVQINVSGFPAGWHWIPETLFVSTYLPRVSISGTGTTIEDASELATFTAMRTGDGTVLSDPLVVRLRASGGTAIEGVDYVPVNSITIPVGQSTGSKAVIPIDDPDAEGFETIYQSVRATAVYALVEAPATAPATNATTRMVMGDDNIRVSAVAIEHLPLPENADANQYYQFRFQVKVTVFGEHLDLVDIRQDLWTRTRVWAGNGAEEPNVLAWLLLNDIVALPDLVNTEGEFKPDPHGLLTAWLELVPAPDAPLNGVSAPLKDVHAFTMPKWNEVIGGVSYWHCFVASVDRVMRMRFRNRLTGVEMGDATRQWWFNWTNEPAKWVPADDPPPPNNWQIVAAQHKNNGKGAIVSDVEGLANI